MSDWTFWAEQFEADAKERSRCIYEYCDCEEAPEVVRKLIHERDMVGRPYTIKARREERIIQAQIDYILGTYDDIEDPIAYLEEAVWGELNWTP
jgi:hypothetical protein